MAKVYLETSFFSACVTTKQGEKSRGWKASSLEWWKTQRMNHELFVSGEVLAELSDPDFIDRGGALELATGITQLSLTEEVWKFAQFLVDEKVMPGPAIQGDAIHVAFATVYEMDFVLSWNVKHLANPNKKTHFAVICMRAGLVPPTLIRVPPDERAVCWVLLPKRERKQLFS